MAASLVHKQPIIGLAAEYSEKQRQIRNSCNIGIVDDEIATNLSGGEQQALALALAVLNPPQILLLDEHTSALDPQAAVYLMKLTNKLINEHHITCILTAHNLEIALNYGNKILALRDGKIHNCIEKSLGTKTDRKELLATCY